MRLPKQRQRYRQQILRWGGLLSVVLFTLGSVGGVVLWRLQSVELLSVQSGSMSPLIHKGDAVLVRKQASAAIRAGDIVSYPSLINSQEIITHRVVYIDPAGIQMVTKGDANASVDPVADASTVIGGVRSVVPKAGFIIDMLHSWHGLTALVYFPATLILIQEMWRIVRYYGQPTYRLLRA
jgi:signal peptidase I